MYVCNIYLYNAMYPKRGRQFRQIWHGIRAIRIEEEREFGSGWLQIIFGISVRDFWRVWKTRLTVSLGWVTQLLSGVSLCTIDAIPGSCLKARRDFGRLLLSDVSWVGDTACLPAAVCNRRDFSILCMWVVNASWVECGLVGLGRQFISGFHNFSVLGHCFEE